MFREARRTAQREEKEAPKTHKNYTMLELFTIYTLTKRKKGDTMADEGVKYEKICRMEQRKRKNHSFAF
jgi:hypothetical protein